MTDTNWPNLREDDFIIRDFRFASGETLPELRQHFITLGTPQTDAAGRIVNASLLIHNTTGTGRTWLEPPLAGELFGPGQPLDAAKHFLDHPRHHRLRPLQQAERRPARDVSRTTGCTTSRWRSTGWSPRASTSRA